MVSVKTNLDLYSVLGVPPTASLDEIKLRYKFLVVAFHPDRFGRNPEHRAQAEERVKQVTEAYHVLSDPEQRTRYDYHRHFDAKSSTAANGAGVWLQSYTQMHEDLDKARSRLQQAEGDLHQARSMVERLVEEKAALELRAGELDSLARREKQLADAARLELALQVQKLTHNRVETERQLKGQVEQEAQQVRELADRLANREALIEQLRLAQSERDRSSDSRSGLFAQQIKRLEQRLRARDAELLQLKVAHKTRENQWALDARNAEVSTRQLALSMQAQQGELQMLQAQLRQFEALSRRSKLTLHLWQAAAAIGIMNALLLLLLYLVR